jgi:hypothetical protein
MNLIVFFCLFFSRLVDPLTVDLRNLNSLAKVSYRVSLLSSITL